MNHQLLKDKLQQRYRSSLFDTCNILLKYKDVNEQTHGPTIRALESDTCRKLICVPRGCLKSSIASVAYPIWILLNNPNARILIDSELYTNSKNFLREIRGHLESPWLSDIFGKFKSSTWNAGEITINQRDKIMKEASITVGGIGTTKVGQHFDYLIMDDMNSEENSLTPENCLKVISHYRGNISILEPTGTLVIIGTRWSELDLIGHVLQNELSIEGFPQSGEYEIKGLIA